MILERLIAALGAMTLAYMLSELSMNLARKLDRSGKAKFLVQILVFIHFFASIASLFVGLFMHYRNERATAPAQKNASKSESDEDTIGVYAQTQSAKPKQEPIYYMEAANGMTVPVPESKLEAWLAEQDRIKNDPAAAELTEAEKKLRDAILHDLYGKRHSSYKGSEDHD